MGERRYGNHGTNKTGPTSRGSVLVEMGALVRAIPRAGAPAADVAAWYERKARLLEHIAEDGGSGSADAARLARQAHRRAAELGGAHRVSAAGNLASRDMQSADMGAGGLR